MNRKRVQRLWREEGLRVPVRPPKRRRVGTSTVPADRLHATRPNEVWAMDFLFDTTSDGRPFKVLAMCDEFTRESIDGALARSITADHVVEVLDEAVARRRRAGREPHEPRAELPCRKAILERDGYRC